jgi:hypothetical protein
VAGAKFPVNCALTGADARGVNAHTRRSGRLFFSLLLVLFPLPDAAAAVTAGLQWDARSGLPGFEAHGAEREPGPDGRPAFRFHGAGDRIEGPALAPNAPLGRGERARFELHVRPGSTHGGAQILFETGDAQQGLAFTLHDSELRFQVRDRGEAALRLTARIAAESGSFVRIVGILDADRAARLYVDGRLVDIVSAAGVFGFGGTAGIGIGGANGPLGAIDSLGLESFDGWIALVRFWQGRPEAPALPDARAMTRASELPATLLTAWLVVLLLRRRAR